MTLRRYAPLKRSRGTVWPPRVKQAIFERDGWECVGGKLGFPAHDALLCRAIEPDHVRASHATGMKSRSTVDNGATLGAACHRWKTDHGKEARPALLDWIAAHPAPEPVNVA